jgi:hypothetical protein
VCVAGGEVTVGLLVSVRLDYVCGFVAGRGVECFVFTGEVIAECGGGGVGVCEGGDSVEHGAGVALGRTRHRRVGGAWPSDMMDSDGMCL